MQAENEVLLKKAIRHFLPAIWLSSFIQPPAVPKATHWSYMENPVWELMICMSFDYL